MIFHISQCVQTRMVVNGVNGIAHTCLRNSLYTLRVGHYIFFKRLFMIGITDIHETSRGNLMLTIQTC